MPLQRTQTWMLGTVAAVLVVMALYWTRPISVPLTFAIFLIAVAWPAQAWLERRLPRALALVGTIGLIVAVVGLLVAGFVYGARQIGTGMAEYADGIEETSRQIVRLARRYGLTLQLGLGEPVEVERIFAVIRATLSGFYVGIAFIGVTMVFLILGLVEVRDFESKVRHHVPEPLRSKLLDGSRDIARKFRRYIAVRTFVSLLTGALTWAFAALVGLELAFVWGLLAFILNYIPFVGSVLAIFPPALFALVQFGGWQAPGLVFLGMATIQITIGNYIDPRLEGRALAMSPIVVIFSIFFWGLVWDVPGAFIGVPMTLALLTLCEQFDQTRWLAWLLGPPPKPKPRSPPGRTARPQIPAPPP